MPKDNSGRYNWEHAIDGISKGVEPIDGVPRKPGPRETSCNVRAPI